MSTTCVIAETTRLAGRLQEGAGNFKELGHVEQEGVVAAIGLDFGKPALIANQLSLSTEARAFSSGATAAIRAYARESGTAMAALPQQGLA